MGSEERTLFRKRCAGGRYHPAVTDFRPGQPLPADDRSTQERQLYHAQLKSGEWATMTREESTWQWRRLRGEDADGYGRGGWREMQKWLLE